MGSLSIHHPRRARTEKWDPPPVDEFGTFLRGSSNHQVLRLVNVKFFGGNAQLGKKSVQLPHLTELILAELIEPVGLGGLFLFLTRLNANASISTSIPSRRSSPTPKSRYGLPPPSKNPLRGARTPSRSSCSAAAGTPSLRRGLRKTKLGLDEANNDPHSTSPSAAPAKDWPMSSAGLFEGPSNRRGDGQDRRGRRRFSQGSGYCTPRSGAGGHRSEPLPRVFRRVGTLSRSRPTSSTVISDD